jgi:hypothetical protein
MDGGGWERVHELEPALRQLRDAAAAFLTIADIELDLSDPASPLHASADALEDALMAVRAVMP